jgi:hypothetical protein
MCQRRHILRAFGTACGPLGPEGRSLTENTPFGGLSAGLRCLNQLASVGRILVFGGLAAIFTELEFAGLLNRQRYAAKRSGYASRKFGGPTSAAKHAAVYAAAVAPSLRKMKLKLNGWLAKGPAHTKQYFSGLI